jgi:hypothetical protein
MKVFTSKPNLRKLVKAGGGVKLSRRNELLFENWGSEKIERLKQKGFPDADLLTLIGQSHNPPGKEIGQAWNDAVQAAAIAKSQIKISIEVLDPSFRKALLSAVEHYAELREKTGRIGAQFEMLAADQLHNTRQGIRASEKQSKGRQERHDKIEEFIVHENKKSASAYSLGHSSKLRKYLEAAGLKPPKDDKTLERDAGIVLKKLDESR